MVFKYKHNYLFFLKEKCGSTNNCKNGGYLKYNRDSKPCVCECPPNTSGSRCENLLWDQYYKKPTCGGEVKEEGVIQTPNFPERKTSEESCTWIITVSLIKSLYHTDFLNIYSI